MIENSCFSKKKDLLDFANRYWAKEPSKKDEIIILESLQYIENIDLTYEELLTIFNCNVFESLDSNLKQEILDRFLFPFALILKRRGCRDHYFCLLKILLFQLDSISKIEIVIAIREWLFDKPQYTDELLLSALESLATNHPFIASNFLEEASDQNPVSALLQCLVDGYSHPQKAIKFPSLPPCNTVEVIFVTLHLISRENFNDWPSFCDWLFASIRQHQLNFHYLLPLIFHRIGFSKNTPIKRLEKLHDVFFMPLLCDMLNSSDFDLAYNLCIFGYTNYIKADDNEKHFAKTIKEWVEPWRFSTKLYSSRFIDNKTNLKKLSETIEQKKPYKVAFHLDGHGFLAHTKSMLATLQAYKTQEYQPFTPVVIVAYGIPDWLTKLSSLGIKYVLLEKAIAADSVTERYKFLKYYLEKNNIDVFVQVCLPITMPFIFSLPIANVQIWWSHKYHDFSMPEIDGYLTGVIGINNVEKSNKSWKYIPPYYGQLYYPEFESIAKELRNEYSSESILLGTFAREEKLLSADYLYAVCQILKHKPQAIFLWSGREKNEMISQAFIQAGVSGQTKFVGWINTGLYAQVIDIFLDTLPLPCGQTLYEAMAASKPVALWDTEDTRRIGITAAVLNRLDRLEGGEDEQDFISKLLRRDSDQPVNIASKNRDVFVDFVCKLVNCKRFRIEVGAISKQLIEKFWMNPQQTGLSLGRHIDSIVKEKIAASIVTV